jgi:hypothetical protein
MMTIEALQLLPNHLRWVIPPLRTGLFPNDR